MKGIRIAYVINSLEGGGAASPVPAIIRVLRDCGAEVRLFALARRNALALPAIEAGGIECEIFEGSEGNHPGALHWLDRGVTRWGATHLWTSLTRATFIGQLAGWRRGLKVVSWQHNAYLKPWNRRLLRLLQSRSLIWVADSRSVRELTARRLNIPEERLFLWPIFAAKPDAPQAPPWRRGETVRLGSLGRLNPRKGYDVLIDALALLKAQGFAAPAPFRISIAGTGSDQAALTQRAADAGIDNIDFVGYRNDPQTFLAGLHLYVQPSRAEGFCIAAHEAMQAGLPVIGSNVGEMPWTLSGGAFGAIVPPDGADELAAALARLLLSPERLGELGQAARRYILEQYSKERFEAAGRRIMESLAERDW